MRGRERGRDQRENSNGEVGERLGMSPQGLLALKTHQTKDTLGRLSQPRTAFGGDVSAERRTAGLGV